MGVEIRQFTCLTDNFGLLLRDAATCAVASIDAPDAAAIAAELDRLGWTLTDILLTHHHADHIQGVAGLKARYPNARVVGPRKDLGRIGGVDLPVGEGDVVTVGAARARVIEAPGHTTGHILYHFADDDILFVGDVLFSLGCGRVFETPMQVMHASLAKIAALPPRTRVYCGHEYTEANARFALTVDPANPRLAERVREVETLRRAGAATLPTTIAQELATNPFLRADDPGLRRATGMEQAPPERVFAALRERKNVFR
ncbi:MULTISPECIES: hydroxyacylglutathione hydrolase [Methylosinus]|uniref:Hydroxyacylglutathione hydrolase n=1 Tax=Methylosinus trichosporium (strain ATCC 35070 / NCIMB 11131 / UNIQEM 75 / OB3b) TaxID=595536 RepID=A0A2D2D4Y6_METT3|nr:MULTISPECIES: hydroxyacylglutathione hydrolase [Methylosinus]ATQ70087.1 hydroxyacylglutathione hydrolase [Methylosinus trichosporium OB3b]OBS54238.1 hydroxyacylglutathione hydrolase [Methylosinus sp. 3S-1]